MKHRFAIYLLALLLTVLLSACADSSSRYRPVSGAQPRISTLGFAISPPPGRDWYEKVQQDSLYYLKKVPAGGYYMYIRATELHFNRVFSGREELTAYVKMKKETNSAPERYKNVRYSYLAAPLPAPCIRYRQHYEDHYLPAQQNTVAPGAFATISGTGLICVHPDNPDIGIEIYYLERTLPGTPAVSFADEGERFLAGLRFLPVAPSL